MGQPLPGAQVDGDPAAAKEWLAWARAYTAGINPLNTPPDPEPTSAALAPFLER
jgi:hypothetical protein